MNKRKNVVDFNKYDKLTLRYYCIEIPVRIVIKSMQTHISLLFCLIQSCYL